MGHRFYQAGEVLLRRRPVDERETIDLTPVIEGVRTDVLIGHVRRPTSAGCAPRTRIRSGTGSGSSRRPAPSAGSRCSATGCSNLSQSSRRNVRGDTDSELFFYLFLSFLHDAGHLATGK